MGDLGEGEMNREEKIGNIDFLLKRKINLYRIIVGLEKEV